jgi:hypothetical protein
MGGSGVNARKVCLHNSDTSYSENELVQESVPGNGIADSLPYADAVRDLSIGSSSRLPVTPCDRYGRV